MRERVAEMVEAFLLSKMGVIMAGLRFERVLKPNNFQLVGCIFNDC